MRSITNSLAYCRDVDPQDLSSKQEINGLIPICPLGLTPYSSASSTRSYSSGDLLLTLLPLTPSTPPLVDAQHWLFPLLLFKIRVIGVALCAPSVVGSWIVGVEGSTDSKPVRKVRIGQEFAAECD